MVGKLACDLTCNAVTYDAEEVEAPEGRATLGWEVIKGQEGRVLQASQEEG